MYNILLDRLPTEYDGYLIRSSFRIGLQICMCFEDVDYTDEEKLIIALNLLYGKGIPTDIDAAVKGLSWFMSCGVDKKENSTDNKTLFYWDFDSSRIFSSFKQTYNIDLSCEDLHWFKFISMIGSLDKDSAFNKAIEIRSFDMKDLKGKARTDMQKMKQTLTPPVVYSEEEQKKIDEFNAILGGDING